MSYIEREPLRRVYMRKGMEKGKLKLSTIINELELAPAVDVAPVVHGRWIPIQYDGYADGNPVWDTWQCSNCASDEYCNEGEPPAFKHCPDCGARMDLEADE